MISEELLERIRLHVIWSYGDTHRGVQLTEGALDFTDTVLDGLKLIDAWIGESNFTGSSLRGADFAHSILASVIFTGCDLTDASLYKCNLDYARCDRSKLTRCDRSDITRGNLIKTTWYKASLVEADLSGAILFRATFRDTDLRGANLTGCELDRSSFERTRVEGTTFTGATGLEEAHVRSINTGTALLEGDAAHKWLLDAAKAPRQPPTQPPTQP